MITQRDEFDNSVEAQLARLQPRFTVEGLRDATLGRVQRELRSSRWDRRLGRVAAVLLVVGIGMNVATINKHPALPTGGRLAARPATESISELAVTMADATDITTASIYVRHLAAFHCFPIGGHQANAIQREVDRRLSSTVSNGKEG
jgi:hypothetical protein